VLPRFEQKTLKLFGKVIFQEISYFFFKKSMLAQLKTVALIQYKGSVLSIYFLQNTTAYQQ
jgi:hypothetical protein